MNNDVLTREAIYKGSALVRGDGLSVLYALCEKQKTISTKKVLEHIERTHDFMKDCAVHMRKLADQLPPNGQGQLALAWLERERLRRYVDAMHGKPGTERHIYNGACPDNGQPDSRDPECPACRLLVPNGSGKGPAESRSRLTKELDHK